MIPLLLKQDKLNYLISLHKIYKRALKGEIHSISFCYEGLCKAARLLNNDLFPEDLNIEPPKIYWNHTSHWWKPFYACSWPWTRWWALKVRLNAINKAIKKLNNE